MVDRIEVAAVRLHGRPGMAVVWPDDVADTSDRGLVLAEDPAGLPVVGLVRAWNGPEDYQPVLGATLSGKSCSQALPLCWTSGGAVRQALAHAPGPATEAALAGLPDLIRRALPGCGFSEGFLDALDATLGWTFDPPGGDPAALFAPTEAGRAMREAVRANPFASWLAYGSLRGRPDPVTMAEALAGAGVGKALLARLREPHWSTEILAGSSLSWGPRASLREPVEFLGLLAAVPLDWIPRDVEGARALAGAFQAIADASGATGIPVRTLCAPFKGQWTAVADMMEIYGPDPEYASPIGALLGDPAAHLAGSVVRAALLRQEIPVATAGRPEPGSVAYGIAARLIYGDKAMAGCLAAGRDWHDRIVDMRRSMAAGAPDENWGKPWPDHVHALQGSRDRYLVTVLDTPAKLEAEGSEGPDADGVEGLSHCVATYAEDIREGRCWILSLRRLRGSAVERIATAEVRPGRGSRVELVQLQGRGNSRPCGEARSVMEYWIRMKGFRPSAKTRPSVRARAGAAAGRARECGFDWSDDAAFARAVSAYAWMFPRGLRDPGALAKQVAAWASDSTDARSARVA